VGRVGLKVDVAEDCLCKIWGLYTREGLIVDRDNSEEEGRSTVAMNAQHEGICHGELDLERSRNISEVISGS
jgi:hypothetical protein